MADDTKQSPQNAESEFQAFSRRADEGTGGGASQKIQGRDDDRNGELTGT